MRPVLLRLAACGLAVIGCARSAAAQVPILRGSQAYEIGTPQFRDWSGFYAGGQVSMPTTGVNFTGGVSSLIANILRVTTVENEFSPSGWASLPKQDVARKSYGGFIGYNVQFGETILGIEANYNHTSVRVSAGDSIARQVTTSDGYLNQVSISGTSNMDLTDYGTLRARAAWIYNSFIPYAFAAVAVGYGSVERSASVSISGSDADPACVGPPDVCLPPYAFSAAESEGKQHVFAYGWALGLGADWAVLPNVFLRGEYEYLTFPKFDGVNLSINSVRLGAGFKF